MTYKHVGLTIDPDDWARFGVWWAGMPVLAAVVAPDVREDQGGCPGLLSVDDLFRAVEQAADQGE